MNRSTETFDDPVELPDGVEHCGPTAYNRYKCRCRYCVLWRRMYDRVKETKRQARRVQLRDGARDYLAYRGVQVFGPGPFRRNPLPLARILAAYLGDDLDMWLNRKDET